MDLDFAKEAFKQSRNTASLLEPVKGGNLDLEKQDGSKSETFNQTQTQFRQSEFEWDTIVKSKFGVDCCPNENLIYKLFEPRRDVESLSHEDRER